MSVARLSSVALIALLALSCASANKLSQKSERELAAGDLPRAYQLARQAVAKEPGNPRARAAFAAAATRLVADRRARILSIAEVDTVAAAHQSLALADLRGEIVRHGFALPADTAFARHEAAIRSGAAGIHYRAGERATAAGTPKQAWVAFRAADRFVAGYRDVDRRIEDAYQAALAHVAILPFADQAGVPGISRALADRIHGELSRHVHPDQFLFTRLLDPERVYARISLAEADDLSRDDAVRIGRRVGADQVVTGRIYGLRSHTDTDRYHRTIYRKVVERDTSGARRERWVEHEFHAVSRERTVRVHYDIEVVDAEDEASLAAFSDVIEGYARVVFSEFQATGDCDDYVLVPPALRRSDPRQARRIEEEWTAYFGNWTLPSLLETARRERHRSRYTSRDRSAFFSDCRERPVWLGGLPDEIDLASIALDVIWQPVLGMLKELDAK